MARLVTLLVALSIGCSSPDRAKQCEELREHLVDLALAESTGIDREAHREAMRGSLGAFVEQCTSSMSDTQVACGLRASDVSSATSCRQ